MGKLSSVMGIFVQGSAAVNKDFTLNGDDGFQEMFGVRNVKLHELCTSASGFVAARTAIEGISTTGEPKRFVLQFRSPSAARKSPFR